MTDKTKAILGMARYLRSQGAPSIRYSISLAIDQYWKMENQGGYYLQINH